MAAAAGAGGGGTAASVGELPNGVLEFGQSTLVGIPTVWWLALALFAGFAVFLSRPDTGRGLSLVGANERAARFNALRTGVLKCLAYQLAGGLAGLAGFVLMARLGHVTQPPATRCSLGSSPRGSSEEPACSAGWG